MAHKILIVDDDLNIGEILEFNLKSEGYDVQYAASAEEALKLDAGHAFDLILLDVMMEGLSGFKLARKLRDNGSHVSIIFITAKTTENDMLTGFSVGGDDYIRKPFSIKEVSARVKAVLKRNEGAGTLDEAMPVNLSFDGFSLDYEAKELFVDGVATGLTKTEFEILSLLASHPDRVYSRDDIIDRVWKETPYITERTVDVHIARLRKKMGLYATHITNRSGYGYRFNLK